MKTRIDYLNRNKQPKHMFLNIEDIYDRANLGEDICSIMEQGATDIHIFNTTE